MTFPNPFRRRPLLLAAVLLAATPAALAAVSQDQALSLGDFSTDVPQHVPDLQFGDAVAVSGNWMAVGAPRSNVGAGEVWIYERVAGDWAYRTRLTAPVPQTGARFGAAVDVYEAAGLLTIIVGSPLFDAAQTDQGRAYVYSDTNAGADFSFSVTAVNPATSEINAQFGAAVALHGDTAAIAAPAAGATDTGQVTIRGRNVGGTNAWGQQGTMKSGNPGNRFGTSVDVHGEYLIVGAPMASNAGGIATGQAYVYRRDQGGANAWGIRHTLTPTPAQANGGFGWSVGIWDSNLGGVDSATRSVVGAPLYDNAGFADTGTVFFFNDATVNFSYSTPASAGNVNAQQGFSVALEGDLAIAGRPAQTVAGFARVGQVNTFRYNGTAWATNTINLTRTGASAGDLYGHAVDVSGTLAVIGAPNARESLLETPPGATRAGGVSTLEISGVTFAVDPPELIARFEQPNLVTDQYFGFSTAMAGEWMAVGVNQDAQKGSNAGAVQMYRLVGGIWTPHSKLTALHGVSGDRFGATVSIDGERLVVGAPGFDGFPGSVSNSGAVYLFEFNGSHWIQRVERASPSPEVDGQFGSAVSIRGDVIAVGARGENGTIGRVHAFRSLADLTSPLTINIAGLASGANAGHAVSVYDPAPGTANDEVIAVGAYNANATQGAAFVLSGATFATTTTLANPAPGSNQFFGHAVAIFNGRVAVGAPSASAAPSGAVHVFSGSGYATVTTLTRPAGAGQFGFSVGLDDGSLVAGAPATAARAGMGAVFSRTGESWSESDLMQPAALAALDEAGTSVALGGGQFVLGTPLHDASAINDSGAAFVFSQAPEVSVTPIVLSVAETGATVDSFVVSLNQSPSSSVTVALTFDATQLQVDAGTGFGASPQTVTLTPANAVSGVTVQVRAIDDALDEADPHATVITTAATASSTPRFAGLVVDDVTVGIADNDTTAVLLTQSGGSTAVSEAGLTDSYTLVLGSQPSASVNVAIGFAATDVSVNGDTDGTYNTTFTTANWDTPQTITVAAVNDRAFEGPHGVTLAHAFVSSDAGYNGIVALIDGGSASNALDVAVTDNETAQLRWQNPAGSGTEGNVYTQGVILEISADPVGGTPVTEIPIGFTSPLVFAGTAQPLDVQAGVVDHTFPAGTTTGATAPVSHTLVDDGLVEGSESFVMAISIATPQPGLSAGANHAATIVDAQSATVALTGTAAVSEAAGSLPLTVTLTTTAGATLSAPVSVAVDLVDGSATYAAGSGDFGFAGPSSTASITFAAGSGNGATQSVVVAITSDTRVEGTESFTAALGTVGGAATAAGAPASLTILDDDTASVAFASAGSNAPEAVATHAVTAVLTLTTTGTGTAQLQDAATVAILQTPGTAATPADYALGTTSLAFPAGSIDGVTRTIDTNIVADALAEGDETFELAFGAVTGAVSASGTHVVTIADDDVAGIQLVQSGGTTTVVEGGASDSYTVVLGSEPASSVQVTVSFDAAQLFVNGESDGSHTLVFTPTNWSQAQDVNIVAVDDTLVEADPHTRVLSHAVSSTDPVYAAIVLPDVSVSISENDLQQVQFVAASSTAGETVGTQSVMARLLVISNGVPGGTITSDFTIDVAAAPGTATAADYALGTSQLTFPAGTPHNSTLPVSLDIVNDRQVESDETLTLQLTPAGGGPIVSTHDVTITDDETAQITFVTAASNVAEAAATSAVSVQLLIGGTGSGSAGLASAASVTVAHVAGTAVAPDDYAAVSTDVSFAAGSLSGETRNVTSSLVDDRVVEGAETYSLTLGAVSAVGAVTASGSHVVTIDDNDSASFGFAPGDDTVGEGVGSFAKAVVLTVSGTGIGPAALRDAQALTLGFIEGTALEPEDFQLAATALTFAAGSADGSSVPASVDIVDDAIAELDESFQLQLTLVGAPAHATLGRSATTVTLDDNDTPGITRVESGGDTTVTEGGAGDSITLVLDTPPTANVTLGFTGTQVATSPASLVFTTADWNVPQTLDITALDDAIAEGPHGGSVAISVASADALYAALSVAPLAVDIADNDSAGVTLVQSGGTTAVEEGGATDTYTVVLTSEPTADVTLTLTGTQVSTTPASLLFTAANWNQAQTVEVTALDDAVAEGPHGGLVATASASTDGSYDALVIADVAVSIVDNDAAGVLVAQSGGTTQVAEGGAGDSYDISLGSEPTAAVTITLTGTEVTPAPATLVFTAANWNLPQTVTISAIDDNVAEGAHTGSVAHTVSSADAVFDGLVVPELTVAIIDNDTAVVQFAPVAVSGNEGDATLAFQVVLTQPVPTDVSVTVDSVAGSAGAGDFTAVSGLVLTFPANSTAAQTVNVALIDDSLDEDDEQFTLALSALVASAEVSLGAATATGTIVDDDAPPVLSVADVTRIEGNVTDTLLVTVTLAPVSGRDVSFSHATADGTAISSGAAADFVALAAATLAIPAGQTSVTIPVTVLGDTLLEADESFSLVLDAVQNATPATASATLTLSNDDAQQTTTTAITSDTPDPSLVGQAYAVSVSVSGQFDSPQGTITLSDGTGASCGPVALVATTAPVATATCNLVSTSPGAKTLTATYVPAGAAFAASSSTEPHQVRAAPLVLQQIPTLGTVALAALIGLMLALAGVIAGPALRGRD